MRARLVSVAILALVGVAFAVPAEANWMKEFAKSVVRDTKRRACWPKPFVRPDVHAVQTPFMVMISNGWRRQNMLCDYHFLAETNELTPAGREKVGWILAEGPRQHRIIYVHRTGSFETTAARIEGVQRFAAQYMPEAPMPPVLATRAAPPGWPAAEVDLVGRKFLDSTPAPRLPKEGQSELD